MKERRWFRRLCCFHKILNNQTPAYLYSLLSPPNKHYNVRQIPKLDKFSAEQKLLVILLCRRQLENGTNLIPQAPSYSVFCKSLLDFIRPTANSTFRTNDVSGFNYWHVFVLVSVISENVNLNIIFKIH